MMGALLPAQQSSVRHPRAIVFVNDIRMLVISLEVTTTTFYVSDSFRVELPLSGQPVDLNYWASAPVFTVKIYIGFPPNPDSFSASNLDLMIVGDTDDMDVDPLTGRVMLVGRDLTSRLIDIKTTKKYPNSTSSAIVTQLAQEHGLTPEVTPTFTKVGTFYQYQQTLLNNETTLWDLITFLAQQEGFVAYVRNETLVFKPFPNELTVNPYVLIFQPHTLINGSPSFNGMGLSFRRSTTLSQNTTVTIRVPFSPKTKKAFNVTVGSTHRQRAHLKGLPKPNGKTQKYVFTIPGLTREQALQQAQQALTDITVHEVKLVGKLPGDNQLKKDSMIKVTGTNTAFDQFYFADHVVRTFSMDEGYEMDVNAKNHSVDSQVTI